MLSELTIENFRGLERLALKGLTRVNVLVGGNNAGKTATLEAIELIERGADAGALIDILRRREEYSVRGESLRGDSFGNWSPFHFDFRGLFFGREPELGSFFQLSAQDPDPVIYRCTARPWEAEENGQPGLFDEPAGLGVGSQLDLESVPLALRIEAGDSQVDLPLNGAASRRVYSRAKDAKTVQFLGTSLRPANDLVDLWAEIALTPQEKRLVSTLRLIEPEVRRVAVLGSGRRGTGVFLQMGDQKQRVPLGSMGEGMRRLFSLALLIGNMSPGGTLLIDEIDTGLHHSVMSEMWKLVTRAAEQLEFQVFASTHSLDCLIALARCASESSLAPMISVHRLEAEMTRAVRFEAAELKMAIEQDLELR